MRKVLLLSFVLTIVCLAQGINTGAAKDDWEEINFEFNSAILSDGFPSMLRLAELLNQHPEYRVKLDGHTDWVGSDKFNQKLGEKRAEAVKAFLEKYGARPGQIQLVSQGKKSPKVDNKSKEGRFMNRRVRMALLNAEGKVISDGGICDALRALQDLIKAEAAKNAAAMQEILKRLDKLDDILRAVNDLKQENAKLKGDLANLKQAQETVKTQVAEAPKPPTTGDIEKVTRKTVEEVLKKGSESKLTLMGVNAGLDNERHMTLTGSARFFSPFNEKVALQAQGEYMHFKGRQEGQFDLGLVTRFARRGQLGTFSSFRHVSIADMQRGATLGQASATLDYLFKAGRLGFYGTKGFKNEGVINRTNISRWVVEETFLRIVDQAGASGAVTLGKNTIFEGNLGWMAVHGGSDKPGGTFRIIQPVSKHIAVSFEGGFNETLIRSSASGRFAAGVLFGNFVQPKTYLEMQGPVPVDVPRVRYEMLTRRARNGNDPPVADAGADQIGVPAGPVTLDGSASLDPDGDPITFQWDQIAGPGVALSGRNTAKAAFNASEGQTYAFRLTVKDDHGATALARVQVSTKEVPKIRIARFSAAPAEIKAGDTATLAWQVDNADEVSISGVGSVDPKAGTVPVRPAETTTYKLTARNKAGQEVTDSVQVTVTRAVVRILTFYASPSSIASGQSANLVWDTENADTVEIVGVGTVKNTGTLSVSPKETTSYTIRATNKFGTANATATVSVTGARVELPRVLSFTANPAVIRVGETAVISWQTDGADSVEIDNGIGAVKSSGGVQVSPKATTTYTIKATNKGGTTSIPLVITVQPAPGPGSVRILSFVVNPANIKPGDMTALVWETENADTVEIVGIGNVKPTGTVQVSPDKTTTYTLRATNAAGTLTSTATVVVTAPINYSGAPRVLEFRAATPQINAGESTALVWRTENAKEVSITELGAVAVNGTTQISPARTTVYLLTAKNDAGETTASVIVNVVPITRILTFTASKASIKPGESAVLSWTTDNAGQVILAGIGRVSENGTFTVAPATTTTYTLTAFGLLNSPQRTATVTIVVEPPVTPPPGANRAPVVNLPSYIVRNTRDFVLDAQATDPDGDALTYQWSAVGMSAVNATVLDPTRASTRVQVSGLSGDYTFQVKVTDSKGASTTQSITVRCVF